MSGIESFVAEYGSARPKFELYCADVEDLLHVILTDEKIHFHSINSRAKQIDSFKKKIQKIKEDGTPKYTDPLNDLTDLAAVRVIVYTTGQLEKVGKIINENFDVKQHKDVGAERSETKDFGYQSIHYLVCHANARLSLPEKKKFANMICEIQVRTILQHAWAEIEHDIQYKSENETPKEIRRKFRSLGGLIDIADREFQSIHDMDTALRDSIRSSAVNDLTKGAINNLDTQPAEAAGTADGATGGSPGIGASQFVSVRGLILEGKYEEALLAYTQNIKIAPNSHTQYLGRAKVRFLLGDLSSALKDLDEAAKLNPGDHAVKTIRSQIEQGLLSPPQSKKADAGEEIELGNAALADGRGLVAFSKFSNAQEAGSNVAFATFNKAMACVLVGDTDGGRDLLSHLRRIPGTPMEINITALSQIIQIVEQPSKPLDLSELKELVAAKPGYDFKLSPLYFLQRGLSKRQKSAAPVDVVFNVLKRQP